MSKKFKGLTASEAELSRKEHGSNELTKIKTKGFFKRFIENLSDPIIRILIIALAIQVVFTLGNCNLIEVFGIVAAIMIATFVSTISEMGSERAFAKIEAENSDGRVRVVRDSSVCELPTSELVVGDIIYVSRGEKISADGTLLSGEVSVDQSALNGENAEVLKIEGRQGGNFDLSSPSKLFRGSVVTQGEGIMRVERVGTATYYGMVARDVQNETRESPLKLRLSKLAKQISVIGYVIAVLVGIAFLFNAFVLDFDFNLPLIKRSLSDPKFIFSNLLRALTLMITVVVVAVPEGLPMMITVVLSANMKKMLGDNILVKKLVGIETAGSLNILFTDKTGTITTGKLSVDRIICENNGYRTLKSVMSAGEIGRALSLSAIYNTDAMRTKEGITGGNYTDRAIGEFFLETPMLSEEPIKKEAFSSEKKISRVSFKNGLTLIKGAPEVILDKCRYYLNEKGEHIASELPVSTKKYHEALECGERVIAVAISEKDSESMVFVALVVLKDNIREGVKRAVEEVSSAGIQIVMVTGDNKDTAVSIAEECGFFRKRAGHIALTSAEISDMSDEEIKDKLPKIRVVARALPQDKTRLVRLSQELDLVVGMTGDGINDAPSLKLADVGFAMGSGTDIAKSAGDIVVLDNSFLSISKSVLYGRTIFKSIRKFITFQLIMNLAACGITLVGQLFGIDSPITIIQMLWVNIIMDTLGGLAFAGEAAEQYYMKEKPKRRDEPILSREMLWQIIPNGIFTLGLLVFFLQSGVFEAVFPTKKLLMCAFYALFIFSGLMNCLCSRSERLWLFRGISKNKPFLLIMAFITSIQLLIIYCGGEIFRSAPLSPYQLMLVFLLASSVLLFDCIRRIWRKLSK